jgi:glycosyltransferase involved in cell wall biosynthesis
VSLPPDFTLLQVTPRLDAGGVERTTVDVARAVVQASGRALVASEGGRLLEELAQAGGEFVSLPVASKNPLLWPRTASALEALVRAEGVHLIHARSRAPAFSALAAARRAGVPFVATYHGVYNARTPWKRWYNAVMTRGDLVIANSAYTREHVLREHRVHPAKVVAIPRGVDLARFDPENVASPRVAALRRAWGVEDDERRPILLLAGRLTRWKGQALAVEALARSGVRAILVLAGDDQGRADYRAALERSAAALGDAVRIVGDCADMPAAYLAADVALAPSLEPEAFGRTAVEPQAMGRPVLAAAHGAATETVADGVTGRLVPPGDVDAWAAALGEALAWSDRRRFEMGREGRARVARLFSLERMTTDTLVAYGRVLEGRRK